MLLLENSKLVGRGLHRECYEHPESADLCVKVVVACNSDENRREASYYTRLSRRGISWDMLARFHGLVETDLGEGAVFQLVRDHDGRPTTWNAKHRHRVVPKPWPRPCKS